MSTAAQKRGYKRRMLPGFPWEGQFETTDQVRHYLSGDRIQCLLCGRFLKSLGWHINAIHDHSEEAYKIRFGIPYTYGLVSEETAKKHSIAVINRPGYMESLPAKAAEMRAAYQPQFDSRKRAICPAVRKIYVDRIGLNHGLPSVIAPCNKCGADVSTQQHNINAGQVQCPDCRKKTQDFTPEQKARIAKWNAENAQRASDYSKAKAWWAWQKNPLPLIEYAKKWNAKLRSMPALIEALNKREVSE